MPALRNAGAARVVVATYLLAPGYFADKVRDAALGAGAVAVSGVLGAAPEVADMVLDRYRAAADPGWPGAAAKRTAEAEPGLAAGSGVAFSIDCGLDQLSGIHDRGDPV